jgi:hypothetical protein
MVGRVWGGDLKRPFASSKRNLARKLPYHLSRTASSTFQCGIGCSPTNPFSAASGTNHGSRNVARNSSTCRKQSRPNASANASDVTAGLGAADTRQARKVAQSVVSVGPPRRSTMLREVVAIRRSRFLTEAYPAEMEGIPTALSPAPRTKRAHASTATLSP